VNYVRDIYPTADADASTKRLMQDANGGTNKLWGGELFGRYNLPNNWASFWGSYSYVDSRLSIGALDYETLQHIEKKSGLPNLSHHNFRFGGTASILRERLFATLSLTLRSTPENVAEIAKATYNKTTLQDATHWPYELGLNVLYKTKYGFDVFTTVHNLTNHKYANVYVDGGSLYPAETISVMAGLRYTR
jgi:hypothetical protein